MSSLPNWWTIFHIFVFKTLLSPLQMMPQLRLSKLSGLDERYYAFGRYGYNLLLGDCSFIHITLVILVISTQLIKALKVSGSFNVFVLNYFDLIRQVWPMKKGNRHPIIMKKPTSYKIFWTWASLSQICLIRCLNLDEKANYKVRISINVYSTYLQWVCCNI